ncbi:unnamed protein product [Durusdinium trenchii]|uniref:Uncharacterized protein n=1 Tax=Durusdinium trenchii TaxID=1381693 RepID=A0ABP0Q8F0_9DINO
MRFSRSLSSPRTPVEVQRAGRAAFRNSGMLQVLIEQWTACSGCWSQSDFYYQVKQRRRHRQMGSRKWMCKSEIEAKFGSKEVAQQIIAAKSSDPEIAQSHIRANPDLHGLDSEETRQYLIWDHDGDESVVDNVTTTLFAAADKDDGRSKTRAVKDKKGRKKDEDKGKKKKKSSSSDSSSSSVSSKKSSSTPRKEAHQELWNPNDKKHPKKGKKGGKKVKKDKAKKGKGKKKSSSSSSSSEPRETEEERKKREEKERAEEEKRKAAEKEKEKKEAFKKDLRKGTQALSKICSLIAKATTLDDRLRNMSASVKGAILAEVTPHLSKMKSARDRLQKSCDAAKVDALGSVLEDANKSDAAGSGFTQNVEMLATLMYFNLVDAQPPVLSRGPSPVAPEETAEDLAEALRCFKAGDFQNAIPLARKELPEDPTDAGDAWRAAMDRLAAAHETAGDVERAEALYLRMLAWREGADQFEAGNFEVGHMLFKKSCSYRSVEDATWFLHHVKPDDGHVGLEAVALLALGEEVAAKAAIAVWTLALRASQREQLTVAGALELTAKAIAFHGNNAELQAAGCGLLRLLCGGHRLAARNRRRLVFLGGVESVLSAMQNFPEDWEVAREACGALRAMAHKNPAPRMRIRVSRRSQAGDRSEQSEEGWFDGVVGAENLR